jgi:uncharacterized protein YdiU (UPF0061 family)
MLKVLEMTASIQSIAQVATVILNNRFASLGSGFFTRLMPQALGPAKLVAWSESTANLLGLDNTDETCQVWTRILSGQGIPNGSDPIATVYSGHQFGVWAGQLGDGRALLLGDIDHNGQHFELQLKGSGKTPYSRMGDGRAVLRSSIREFLCSEAMAALGVPTTRALAVVGAQDPVIRETIETAAVVLRVAPTFIRFGHFEHFASQRDTSRLKALADFVIAQYFPACKNASNPYVALLEEVAHATAETIAQWQCIGFMHGVMNTDNMSILGLTIDYGPFGFMDAFDAGHICNHSDEQGRYAYHMQPQIGHWNIAALAEALSPLIEDEDAAKQAVQAYVDSFEHAYTDGLRAKLGLRQGLDADAALLTSLLQLLHANHADWTVFFRTLSSIRVGDRSADTQVRDLLIDRQAADVWLGKYHQRLAQEHSIDADRARWMNTVNPKFILRNYLAEQAIRKAADDKDFSQVATLLKVLEKPFEEQKQYADYSKPPPEWAQHIEVSCSS